MQRIKACNGMCRPWQEQLPSASISMLSSTQPQPSAGAAIQMVAIMFSSCEWSKQWEAAGEITRREPSSQLLCLCLACVSRPKGAPSAPLAPSAVVPRPHRPHLTWSSTHWLRRPGPAKPHPISSQPPPSNRVAPARGSSDPLRAASAPRSWGERTALITEAGIPQQQHVHHKACSARLIIGLSSA